MVKEQTWAPPKTQKRSDLTPRFEVEEKEELNTAKTVMAMAAMSTGVRWPRPPTWAERFIGITSSAPRGRCYYDPHFRVEETEERGDEVICANRTRMIVLKNKESRQKKKKRLGRRMRPFLQTGCKLPLWVTPALTSVHMRRGRGATASLTFPEYTTD